MENLGASYCSLYEYLLIIVHPQQTRNPDISETSINVAIQMIFCAHEKHLTLH